MRANSIHERELKVKICDEISVLNCASVEAILGAPFLEWAHLSISNRWCSNLYDDGHSISKTIISRSRW
jgi:hypothetical protein